MRGCLCAALFFLSLLPANISYLEAQEPDFLENLLQTAEEEDTGNNAWMEYLWELRNRPLNINTATLYDLTRIPFLSPEIAARIIRRRRIAGEFHSPEELLAVKGMDEELYEALLPFITLKKPLFAPRFVYRIQSHLLHPLSRGYREKDYENPLYLNQRLLFDVNERLSGGVVWEKDAGEGNYFDYGSFHLLYRHPGSEMEALVGDYLIKTGCGLLLSPPYGSPFSPDAIPLKPETDAGHLSGYRSTYQNGFLRGIALQVPMGRDILLKLFVSSRSLDANIDKETGRIRSLYSTGLHRTSTEKEKIGCLEEQSAGLILQRAFPGIRFQLTGLFQKYSPGYQNTGNPLISPGLSWLHESEQVQFSGELAFSESKFPALEQDLFFSVDDFRYQLTAYYFHPAYLAPRGRSPGSMSRLPGNQAGMAQICRMQIFPRTRLSGMVHMRRTIRDSGAPVFVNVDYYLKLEQKFRNQVYYLQYRQANRENDVDLSDAPQKRIVSARFHQKLKLGKAVSIVNRVEVRWAKPMEPAKRYYGFSMFHQMQWQGRGPLQLLLRWTSFDAGDYDVRLYEYEPDLPGSFRSVLLNGYGFKWLLCLQLKLSGQLQLVFKYQQRVYPDRTTTGSGRDEVASNRLRDFRAGLTWRY